MDVFDSRKYFSFVEPSKEESDLVKQLYEQHPVNNHYIKQIQIIENPDLYGGFLSRIKKLHVRASNTKFSSKWETGNDKRSTEDKPDDIDHRKEIYESLRNLTEQYKVEKYPEVKFLPVWHGTSTENLSSICHSGYAALGTTDDGYFGKGIYGTVEAEYAFRVYSKRKGVLLLNWMVFYSAYPIIPKEKETFKGKPHFLNYDAHYIPVSPLNPDNELEEHYFPCERHDTPVYRELVVFEEASCFPRFLVTLSSDQIDQSPQLCASDPIMTFLEAEKVKNTNPEEYRSKLIKAAEQGYQLALFELGWHYRKLARDLSNSQEDTRQKKQEHLKLAFDCFRKAASLGLETARLEMGFCYKRGDGVDQDPNGAIKIFESLSNRFAMADYELGFHYNNGDGVDKDPVKAFHHWKLAAKKSMSRAEYRVGICYFKALGTERDLNEAKKYLERAADKGNPEAIAELVNINSLLKNQIAGSLKSSEKDEVATSHKRNSHRDNRPCLIM
jgi:hypothetical protein